MLAASSSVSHLLCSDDLEGRLTAATGPALMLPVIPPLCCTAGEVAVLILGDGDIAKEVAGGWAWDMGDRGGKVPVTGEVCEGL